jgi:hypothetical protein
MSHPAGVPKLVRHITSTARKPETDCGGVTTALCLVVHVNHDDNHSDMDYLDIACNGNEAHAAVPAARTGVQCDTCTKHDRTTPLPGSSRDARLETSACSMF